MYLPAGQDAHADVPVFAAYLPPGHGLHWLLHAANEYDQPPPNFGLVILSEHEEVLRT